MKSIMPMMAALLMAALPLGAPAAVAASEIPGDAEVVDLGLAQGGEAECWASASAADEACKPAALAEYVRRFPQGAHAAQALVEQARRQPDLAKARLWLKQAMEADPRGEWGCQAAADAGQAAYVMGEFDEALQALDAALACSPRAQAFCLRGQARLVRKDAAGALDDFRRALLGEGGGLAPGLTQSAEAEEAGRWVELARLGRAEALLALGQTTTAMAALRQLWEPPASPWAAQALWHAGQLCRDLSKTAEARECWTRLVEGYGDSFEANKARQLLASLPAQAASPTVRPAKPDRNAAEVFTVQVGVFSQAEAAQKLANKLRKRGYPVQMGSRLAAGHKYIDVTVGRYSGQEKARAAASKLASREKLPTLVKVIEK